MNYTSFLHAGRRLVAAVSLTSLQIITASTSCLPTADCNSRRRISLGGKYLNAQETWLPPSLLTGPNLPSSVDLDSAPASRVHYAKQERRPGSLRYRPTCWSSVPGLLLGSCRSGSHSHKTTRALPSPRRNGVDSPNSKTAQPIAGGYSVKIDGGRESSEV